MIKSITDTESRVILIYPVIVKHPEVLAFSVVKC